MKPLPLTRIAEATGGRLHDRSDRAGDVLIDAVATDSRTLDTSDGSAALFVALRGANFDGHDHVAAAAAAGARAALVSRQIDAPLPQVVVADTQRALGALAAMLQRERGAITVAITGSNGKTTVKTLLLSILRHAAAGAGRVAYANPGNRNNEIGLPLAVIDAPEDAQFAIYEMGAGKPGDIAYLATIARPQAAVVNNVAAAHLERLGSLDGVADTKAAIYDALPAGGVAVVNADDAFAEAFVRRIGSRTDGVRILRFGLDRTADVGADDVRIGDEGLHFRLRTPQGEAAAMLPLSGRHNLCNALAAAALAHACGASLRHIVEGLGDAQPVVGRLTRHRLANGAVLIDDSYNANPGSLQAAIDTLASARGEAWLVLGDMRELGDQSQALHEAAGRNAKAAGIRRLYALGKMAAAAADAFGEGARTFDSHEAIVQALRADLHTTVRVLVKGSRGSAMDRVVAALLPQEEGDADAA